MANIKQQIKRNKTNEKSRVLNLGFKSSVRTAVKKVETAVRENNKDLALESLNFAFKKLDKGNNKGIYHKNFIARKKSRLQKLVNTLN